MKTRTKIESLAELKSRRRRELNEVEMRRLIEEHMEKQKLKAQEGELAELY